MAQEASSNSLLTSCRTSQSRANANFLDMTVYPLCAQAKYRELPEPFNLKAEPKVPYSLQIVIVPSYLPPDKEQDYVDIFKHIYLHKNKVSSADCVSFCHGAPVCFDWGKQTRLALAGLNMQHVGSHRRHADSDLDPRPQV